jgi:ATP-binding cassette subfamily B (MDR/TAP) protein 1
VLASLLVHDLTFTALGLAFWYGGKLLSERKYDVQTFFVIFIAIIFGGQAAGFLFGFTLSTSVPGYWPLPALTCPDTTKAHSAANHIIDLRRSRPPINTSTGSKPASDQSDIAIEFRDVRFSYPTRSEQVLRGINLKIRRGQKVGVVGASGCGKTTIISVLERFYDIDSGALLIHGQPLTSLDVHAYRSMIGLVSQDTTLYQGSIRENVLLGHTGDVDEARLIQACKDANIHDFITSLPEGYDTDAGSRGLALSGGQRQRIAIARALIRDPEILLFDEATSALDTQGEAVVQKALETAAKGRTTVAVAHRLSTIRDSDLIIVLDGGKVVEQGTHDALVSKRGRYREMVLAQTLDREAK